MVLWEITLGTAYFLGLKRTYRLALKIQRRLISPKHPKIRNFVRRRTRTVFDVALKFHKNIQERDIEVGRNLGNWILRWLDKMKPSAQIRGDQPTSTPAASAKQSPAGSDGMPKTNIKADRTNKLPKSSSPHNTTGGGLRRYGTNGDLYSGRSFFAASGNVWSRPYETQTVKGLSGNMIQQRFLSIGRRRGSLEVGVIRKDIMQWIMYA